MIILRGVFKILPEFLKYLWTLMANKKSSKDKRLPLLLCIYGRICGLEQVHRVGGNHQFLVGRNDNNLYL